MVHEYCYPEVAPVAQSVSVLEAELAVLTSDDIPEAAAPREGRPSQRDLVAASLLRLPSSGRAGRGTRA